MCHTLKQNLPSRHIKNNNFHDKIMICNSKGVLYERFHNEIRNKHILFHVYNWIQFLFLCMIILQQEIMSLKLS